MRIRIQALFVLLTCLLLNSLTLSAHAAAPAEASLAPMLQTALPSIVNIRAKIKVTDINALRQLLKQRRGMEGQNQEAPDSFNSVASGVIVDAKHGYILTNAHVVADAEIISIALSDGRHFRGKLIGMDKPSDIAVLQIKAVNLTAMPLGNSNNLKVGDYVAAIGNPFGLSQTVTSGIVSALGRTTLGIENFENFIQTDAPINMGNSGGALVSMQGQLIGINTAILAPDRGSIGIGFAIPINMAASVMQQILQYGDVKRGVLGIGAQDITPDLATAFSLKDTKGAVVTQVIPGSPAQQGGLAVGDIIVSINQVPIKNASDVVNTIGFLRVDSKITINVSRNQKPLAVAVTLSDPKQRMKQIENTDPYLFGLTLKDFTLLSPVHGNVEGILVVAIDPESKAWQYDLRPGDVISSANNQRVKNIDDLKAIVGKTGNTLLLNVLRGPGAIFIVINRNDDA